MNKLLQKLDVIGLVLLIATAVRYSVNNVWDVWTSVLAILGGVCVVAGLATNYRQIITTLGKRSTKYSTNYVVSVLLVFGLVAGLNFLAQRHPKRFDCTASGQYTLAAQSVQITRKLDRDLIIKAFYPEGDNPPLRELLSQYRDISSHVRFEFFDPDRRPELARQYGVKEYSLGGLKLRFGTVVMLYGDRTEKLEKGQQAVTEEDLTRTIIRLQRTDVKKAYFLQGNGEKDPASNEGDGYSVFKKALEDESFVVENLNLAGRGEIPADASVLIEAGPTVELLPDRVQLLKDFTVNRGGCMLILVDPSPAAGLASFLAEWGVVPDNDLIVSPGSYYRSPEWPVVASNEYQSHPITENFKLDTLFPSARSVQPTKTTPAGVNVSVLFKTMDFPKSWGKTNVKAEDVSFSEKSDLKGPLPLAVAVSKEVKPATDKAGAVTARLVVVGNSMFAANALIRNTGNANLVLNMANWLVQREDMIAVRPKSPDDRKIILTDSQQKMVAVLVLVLFPGAAVVAGIVVSKRRRK